VLDQSPLRGGKGESLLLHKPAKHQPQIPAVQISPDFDARPSSQLVRLSRTVGVGSSVARMDTQTGRGSLTARIDARATQRGHRHSFTFTVEGVTDTATFACSRPDATCTLPDRLREPVQRFARARDTTGLAY
jgi:hypothetical protein